MFVKRGVYGVGLDTPSLDAGKNETFSAHQTLLGANIFGLENLNLSSTEIPGNLLFYLNQYIFVLFLTSCTRPRVAVAQSG